jgi:putative peptidoglycan lipid II flippase
MTSRILGVVREQVIAAYFGAGAATDAYNVAFRVPGLLRDLFAEGAMSAAFVPTFTGYLTTSGKERAWRVGNNVISALTIVTGVLVVVGIVFADPLLRMMTDDAYVADADKFALTVTLARIMLPALTLIALAAAFMGMLNALHHFFIPALSPAMFNVLTIACAVTLVPLFTRAGIAPIIAIAIGTLLGGVAQLAVQWPTLRREGFRYRPILDWRDEGLRRVLVLMGPGTVGLAATQVNLLVNLALATSQATGAPSWLNYAFRIMYLPIGLFGVSIATATLPTVSRQVAQKDVAAVRETISHGIALMLMLNVPATIGLAVLSVPIVRVLLERGAFSASDTMATAAALQFYAVGLVGYSIVRITSPVFYALGRNRTPVAVSMVAVLVNAGLNIALVRVMGYTGLALGTSLAALFNAATLMILLRRATGGIAGRQIAVAVVKIAIASIVMGAVAWSVDRWLLSVWPGRGLAAQIVRLLASIGAAIAALAASAFILRIQEFTEGMDLVLRRFRRRAR